MSNSLEWDLSHRTLHWNVTSAFLFRHSVVPHPFLPRNVRLPKSGSGSGRAVGTDARRAARQETSPGAKPLVTIFLWGWLPNRENIFFGRGRQCFGSQVMNDQKINKKHHHLSRYHQPRVRRKRIQSTLTLESLGQPSWAGRRSELSKSHKWPQTTKA